MSISVPLRNILCMQCSFTISQYEYNDGMCETILESARMSSESIAGYEITVTDKVIDIHVRRERENTSDLSPQFALSPLRIAAKYFVIPQTLQTVAL
jgi:hypothetical protein